MAHGLYKGWAGNRGGCGSVHRFLPPLLSTVPFRPNTVLQMHVRFVVRSPAQHWEPGSDMHFS
eukprot:2643091-Heterocapsa_arctica.AAC.1